MTGSGRPPNDEESREPSRPEAGEGEAHDRGEANPSDSVSTEVGQFGTSLRAYLAKFRTRLADRQDRILFKYFPRWWGRRSIVRDQSHHDQHDAESFAAAALPEQEEVGLRAVWVMELYLASHVPQLVSGLRAFGLDKPHPFRNPLGGHPLDAILAARTAGNPGWGIDFPPVLPRGKAGVGSIEFDLPTGVSSLFLKAITPVPGVTVLVAQFRFDDDTARTVEVPLRTMYLSAAVPHRGAIQYAYGAFQREDALVDVRAALRRRCERWMLQNLPGAYAGFRSEPIPSAELLTFQLGDPLGGRTPPSIASGGTIVDVGPAEERDEVPSHGFGDEDYLTLLGQRDSEGWACADMPGLVLRVPRTRLRGRVDDHLVLSARIGSFDVGAPLSNDRTHSHETVTHRTSWLAHTLALFALRKTLGIFERQIAEIRDRLGEVPLNRPRKAISQMQGIERQLAQIARDARPMFRGIVSAPAGSLTREVSRFLPLSKEFFGNEQLFAWIATSIVDRCKSLLEAEEENRETARTVGGLLITSANLTAAKSNLRLQFAAIIISAIALIVAVMAQPTALQEAIKRWLQ
jgi:hypothetical protein